MWWNFELSRLERLAVCVVLSTPLWITFGLGFLAGRYL
jgi:hypothetical protein